MPEFETHLWTDSHMDAPRAMAVGHGAASVLCRGLVPEAENQDSAGIILFSGDHLLLVIADGAGGQPDGARASATAVDKLVKVAKKARHNGSAIRHAVLDGFELANSAIRALGTGAASTLVVAEVDRNQVRTWHAGDSGALVTGQRGRIKHVTIAHSPVGYALESGLLSEREAHRHEHRHFVSNLLGDPEMRIEVGPTMTLAPRDTLVLGTDGLFDNLYHEEIASLVRTGPIQAAAAALDRTVTQRMHTAERGKQDDLSFILYRPRRQNSTG